MSIRERIEEYNRQAAGPSGFGAAGGGNDGGADSRTLTKPTSHSASTSSSSAVYDTTSRVHRIANVDGGNSSSDAESSRTSKIGGLLHPFSFSSTASKDSSSSDPSSVTTSSEPIPVKSRSSLVDPYGPVQPRYHLLSSTPLDGHSNSTDTLVPLHETASHPSSVNHSYPPAPNTTEPPSDHSDIDSPSTPSSSMSRFAKLKSASTSILPSALGGKKKRNRKEMAERRRRTRLISETIEPQMPPPEATSIDGDEEREKNERERRMSSSSTSDPEGLDGGRYSFMEASESRTREERRAEKEFRDAFALPKDEALLEREFKRFSHRSASWRGVDTIEPEQHG